MIYSRCPHCHDVSQFEDGAADDFRTCPRCSKLMRVLPRNPDELIAADVKASKAKERWQWALVVNSLAAVALILLTGFLATPFVVWWYWKHLTVDREKTIAK